MFGITRAAQGGSRTGALRLGKPRKRAPLFASLQPVGRDDVGRTIYSFQPPAAGRR